MKHAPENLKVLLPLLLVACISFRILPSIAQTPGAQAWSATSQALSQDLSSATAQALYSGEQALSSKIQAKASKKQASDAITPMPVSTSQALATPMTSSANPTMPSQAVPKPYKPYKSRRTLFVEVAQRQLRLEAPEKMCFLDRTSAVDESIYLMLSAVVERHRDQVMLGVFMPCDDITSPDTWLGGMPDAGFVTWINPAVGETTPMSRQDYLDMREASFPQYAKGRAIGSKPDKTVHRNEYNVSLAFKDEQLPGDGSRHSNTSILATTLLRHVPIEITLHYEDNPYAGKTALKFPQAYAAMDKLVAQQITLNE